MGFFTMMTMQQCRTGTHFVATIIGVLTMLQVTNGHKHGFKQHEAVTGYSCSNGEAITGQIVSVRENRCLVKEPHSSRYEWCGVKNLSRQVAQVATPAPLTAAFRKDAKVFVRLAKAVRGNKCFKGVITNSPVDGYCQVDIHLPAQYDENLEITDLEEAILCTIRPKSVRTKNIRGRAPTETLAAGKEK